MLAVSSGGIYAYNHIQREKKVPETDSQTRRDSRLQGVGELNRTAKSLTLLFSTSPGACVQLLPLFLNSFRRRLHAPVREVIAISYVNDKRNYAFILWQ
ncbi:MAG TPA: hypothetical protein VFF30_01120 [Nitrososphaerales archaeon]|nr:hypothetical protein [Nitrososphaerales archaeon]